MCENLFAGKPGGDRILKGFIKSVALSLTLALGGADSAPACTNFLVKASDGSVIVGRTMEFPIDLQSKLVVQPRGQKRQSTTPGGGTGLAWTAKFGYVMLNAFGLDFPTEGVNEKGLSFSFLWLPESVYEAVSPADHNRALELSDVGSYILGTCSTVEEARQALKNGLVWGKSIDALGGMPTVHIAVHDAGGNSLVVEFIEGEKRIYDNPLGVLTNSPQFPWHITNLRNYVHLSAKGHDQLKVAGMEISETGKGSGLLGMPGDLTPLARFVRTATMVASARPAADAASAVNVAEHILNSLDYPKGLVRDPADTDRQVENIQWVVIEDLTNRVIYYKSYDNLNRRFLDLKKVDLDAGAAGRSISIED